MRPLVVALAIKTCVFSFQEYTLVPFAAAAIEASVGQDLPQVRRVVGTGGWGWSCGFRIEMVEVRDLYWWERLSLYEGLESLWGRDELAGLPPHQQERAAEVLAMVGRWRVRDQLYAWYARTHQLLWRVYLRWGWR